MKIKTLIEILKDFDQDKDVIIVFRNKGETHVEELMGVNVNGGHAQLNTRTFINTFKKLRKNNVDIH